jgi:hypothetical protein
MKDTELSLIVVIYGLYLWDCLHWIERGAIAFTATTASAWKKTEITKLTYTLLGRAPVLRNPFLFTPGLIIIDITSGKRLSAAELAIQLKTIRTQTRLLQFASTVSAIMFLVILPAIVKLGLISFYWRPLLTALALAHFLTIGSFFYSTPEWRKHDSSSYRSTILSLALNPLAALRSADLYSKWKFSHISSDSPGLASLLAEK